MKLIIFALVVVSVTCAPAPQESKEARNEIPIVKYENEGVNADGSYTWNFETGNNIIAQETGQFKSGNNPEEGEMEVSGSYEYTNPDGSKVQISYIANKDGFQPQGDVLPTPPPIPPAIQRLLEWLKAHPSEEDQNEGNRV